MSDILGTDVFTQKTKDAWFRIFTALSAIMQDAGKKIENEVGFFPLLFVLTSAQPMSLDAFVRVKQKPWKKQRVHLLLSSILLEKNGVVVSCFLCLPQDGD
jgi:hypothetical protein